jgi:hypothetical protein
VAVGDIKDRTRGTDENQSVNPNVIGIILDWYASMVSIPKKTRIIPTTPPPKMTT